jgi:membrane fusion protein, copper/silver efflux system
MNNMGGNGSAGFRSPATDASSAGGDGIQLREGMYIRTGQPLLKIVDPNQLWAEFNISAGEVNSLAKGAPIQITFPQLPSENLTAKIDFIQPFFEAGENFAKVRVYLPGQQRLAMAGQLVSGKASYRTESTLWVPKAAVVDIGTRSVAFKKTGKVFEPIAVVTGIVKGNEIQIMEGLQRNDKIAANAQFMVDSESFINLNK